MEIKEIVKRLQFFTGSWFVGIKKEKTSIAKVLNNNVIPWASVSKPLVAIVVLKLIQEGLCDLDENVGIDGVTLRNLLDHSSGMSFDDSKVLLAKPGTRRIYSNAGYRYIAEFFNKRFGINFLKIVNSYIKDFLKLRSACFNDDPASGVSSNFADLIRFAKRVANNELGLTANYYKLLFSASDPGIAGKVPNVASYADNLWAIGFELKGKKVPHWMPGNASGNSFGHFGKSGALFFVEPEKEVCFVGYEPIVRNDFYLNWSTGLSSLLDYLHSL